MNIKQTVVAGSVIAVLLIACNQPDEEATGQKRFLPEADVVADAGKGERLYRANCARCHGQKARGSNQGPPLVHEVYRPGHHADPSFYRAAKDGVRQHHWQFGDMPPLTGISVEDVAHIIDYVRQEQRKNGIH